MEKPTHAEKNERVKSEYKLNNPLPKLLKKITWKKKTKASKRYLLIQIIRYDIRKGGGGGSDDTWGW